MATHSSILAWRMPWIEQPGELQSIRLGRVGHIWSNWALTQGFNSKVWLSKSSSGGGAPDEHSWWKRTESGLVTLGKGVMSNVLAGFLPSLCCGDGSWVPRIRPAADHTLPTIDKDSWDPLTLLRQILSGIFDIIPLKELLNSALKLISTGKKKKFDNHHKKKKGNL